MLALGLVILSAADLVLATSEHWRGVLVGVSTMSVHMSMTQGVLATTVADIAPGDLRGTAFGLFNLIGGIAMPLASVLTGFLWDRLGRRLRFTPEPGFA